MRTDQEPFSHAQYFLRKKAFFAVIRDISVGVQTKIFSENIEHGTTAVVNALLKHTASVDITEDVKVMVLDVRGWLALHNAGADASLTMKAIVDDGDAAANKAVDGAPATAAVPDAAAVNAGVANAAAGVTNATGDTATGTRDVPAPGAVAAGATAAAEAAKPGVVES